MIRNTVRIAFLIVLCASALGQTNSSAQTAGTEAPQHPSPIDVYEAVLRYQVRTWKLAAQSYCIQINGKDAHTALLDRLKPLPVKMASACSKQMQLAGMMQVVDRRTGKQSVIFDIGEIRWPNQSAAEVDGGYLCGSLCMAGGTYYLALDAGRWIVTKFNVHIQS